MADPLSDLFARAGFAGRMLQDSYKSSIQPAVESAGQGAFGALTTGLQALGRPAGALRAFTMGESPVEGFKRPEDFSYVNPKANLPTRLVQGMAEAVVDPLNLLGAKWMSPLGKTAPLASRFAVEAAISAGSRAAGDLALEALPEDAPTWAHVAAPLVAGLAAGAYGNVKAGGVKSLESQAVRRAQGFAESRSLVDNGVDAIDEMINQRPNAVLADLTTPPATDLRSVQRAQEGNLHLAALDEMSPKLIDDLLAGGSTANQVEINTQFALDSDSLLSERYGTWMGVDAANATMLAKQQIANLPEKVKSNFFPTWMARIVNGQANRDPAALQGARIGHNYISGQKSPVAMVMDDVANFVRNEVGEFGEKVSIRPEASDSARQAFQLLQDGKYGNGALGFIAEHPNLFNLTDTQRVYLDDLQTLLKNDARLSGQFGVDTSYLYKTFTEAIADARKLGDTTEVKRLETLKATGVATTDVLRVENYARHMTELLGPDGKKLPVDAYPHFLGTERSFQKRRLFDSWEDIALSAANRDAFAERINSAIRAAIAENDIEEATRLQDLLNSGIQVGVRRASFAEAVGERLSQSARQRGEALAIKMVKEAGGDILAENELKSLLNAAKIPDWLKLPAKAAGFIRGMQLRLDASILGVQSWGAVSMGRGLRGGIEGSAGDFLKTIGTEEGWAGFRTANAARMSNWVMHDLNLSDTVLELPDDLDLLRRKIRPQKPLAGNLTAPAGGAKQAAASVINAGTGAMEYLDKVQFSRMATAWKLDMAEHTFGLLKAARDGHMGFGEMLTHPSLALARVAGEFKGQTDDQLMRAAASFSNNVFGGLNATAQGRSAIQNLVENIFVLTPGFTRGTVSIGLQAANLGKWTPEAALARDFAIRGTLMAATMVKGLTYALNGLDEHGNLREANVTDYTKDDWMDIPLPNGQTLRPLSRWRGPAKMTAEAVDKMLSAGPIEAGMMFGADALRWATYRQSGLVTDILGDPIGDVARAYGPKDELGQPKWGNAGNQFARDKGVLNLLLTPTADPKGQAVDMLAGNLPVSVSKARELVKSGASPTEIGIALGAELFGVGQQTPSKMERQVWAAGGEAAVAMGLPEDLARQYVLDGKNPVYAKNEQGQFILNSAQRAEAVQKIAAATGHSPDIVRQGGRATLAQRQEILNGIKTSQLDGFFSGIDAANAKYAEAMKTAEQALANGMPPAQVSRFISDARTKRAAARDSVEQMNPAAIAFLQSPDQKAKQNSHDALMSAISAEAYGEDFFDPQTLEFDFDKRDQHYARLRQKYGASFDTWLKQSDAKKTPFERDRDHAFERLGTYFRVGDEIWQRTTGGAFGDTEKDFDRQMREMLQGQGVTDPGVQSFVLNQLKQNIKPIALAHSITPKVRNMMRAADPQTEADVTKWLGAQPIALKKVSRADRALLNQLSVQAD